MSLSLEQKRFQAGQLLTNALIMNAPKDTWNLALNGIRLMGDENGEYEIVIGGEVAPYAVYTNEPWNNGINPNEHWINNTIEQMLPSIQQIFEGVLEEDDVREMMEEMTQNVREQYQYRIAELEGELREKQSKLNAR